MIYHLNQCQRLGVSWPISSLFLRSHLSTAHHPVGRSSQDFRLAPTPVLRSAGRVLPATRFWNRGSSQTALFAVQGFRDGLLAGSRLKTRAPGLNRRELQARRYLVASAAGQTATIASTSGEISRILDVRRWTAGRPRDRRPLPFLRDAGERITLGLPRIFPSPWPRADEVQAWARDMSQVRANRRIPSIRAVCRPIPRRE